MGKQGDSVATKTSLETLPSGKESQSEGAKISRLVSYNWFRKDILSY